MFDKTLDAALGKRELMSANFEELNEQLEETKKRIIEESIKEIGTAGEQERKGFCPPRGRSRPRSEA